MEEKPHYKAKVEILLELTTGLQPLCISQALEGPLVSVHNEEIKSIHWEKEAFVLSKVLEKNPSLILGITSKHSFRLDHFLAVFTNILGTKLNKI